MAAAIAALSIDQRSGALVFLTGAVAVAALVLVLAALIVGGGLLLGAALALLGLLQFVHVLLLGELSTWSLGVASVGLLLLGELTQWSLDSRSRGRLEVGMHVSRAVGVAWLAAFATGVVAIVMAAGAWPMEEGTVSVAVATIAAVTLLGLVGLVSTIGRNQEPLDSPGVPRGR